MKRFLLLASAAVIGIPVAMATSSFATLMLLDLWNHPYFAGLGWMRAWVDLLPQMGRSFKASAALTFGGIAGVASFAACLLAGWRAGGKKGRGRPSGADGPESIKRGASMNHGQADFMPLEEAMKIFPPSPEPLFGGFVVGEAVRMDLSEVANVRYVPKDRSTWGPGGTAPLMFDHGEFGSTHSLVIGGSGIANKTSTLATLILMTLGSLVVFDPAEELADMLQAAIEAQGRRVVRLGSTDEDGRVLGLNPLARFRADDPMMEAELIGLVGDIMGVAPGAGAGDGTNAGIFHGWAQDIITCILAHIIAAPNVEPEDRNLYTMRHIIVAGGMAGLRDALAEIAEVSASSYARGMAESFAGWADEQWSGAYGNAQRATEWLGHEAMAQMVSHNDFAPTDLMGGNTVVFVQPSMNILKNRPAVGRVLMGSLLAEVFEAKGQFVDEIGRIGFVLDEAALLGPMPILETIGDQGRKYGISMQLIYQSEQNLMKIWGSGWQAWYTRVSWVSFCAGLAPETAERLSNMLGQYAAEATSVGENKGKSRRWGELNPQRSTGDNVNMHEVARKLMLVHEIFSDLRADERITIPQAGKPIRHGAAIGFRRPEIAPLLGSTTFRSQQEPAHV